MDPQPAAFYDALAEDYHLIFQDWDVSIRYQAGVLGPLIEAELGPAPLRILDCACGIGTQSMALAGRGHRVVGSDVSTGAVARARREAAGRKLPIDFYVADLRDLTGVPEAGFDAVIAADNALPHLEGEELLRGARAMAGKLRAGGLLLATIRDYDRVLAERPSADPPRFFDDQGRRRFTHQVWDWLDERTYRLHLFITREMATGWDSRHYVSTCRALLRGELAAILEEAGLSGIRWRMPEESGYYQPLVVARR